MKVFVVFFVLLCGVSLADCQVDSRNTVYLSSELNVGNYFGLDLGLNYVIKDEYSIKVGWTGNIRKPKSQPSEYSSGISSLIFLGLDNPYDQFHTYQVGVGKIYKLNDSGTIRANISLGLGYTMIKEPENWERNSPTSGFAENYTWSYRPADRVSLIINPKIEFPFSSIYGLTISPMLQINKDRTYVGIGFGKMMGILQRK